jgi:hypothetical protein
VNSQSPVFAKSNAVNVERDIIVLVETLHAPNVRLESLQPKGHQNVAFVLLVDTLEALRIKAQYVIVNFALLENT